MSCNLRAEDRRVAGVTNLSGIDPMTPDALNKSYDLHNSGTKLIAATQLLTGAYSALTQLPYIIFREPIN